MTPHEAYLQFLALKFHFAGTFVGDHHGGDYDYFRYRGKIRRISKEKFNKSGEKIIYTSITNKMSDSEILDYYLANFIRGVKWITDFNQENWIKHIKINQSLQYFYENDIENLLTNADNFDILFKCESGNHPKLLKAYNGKKINLETLIILEKVLQYREVFDQQISETYIWPKTSILIRKYEPFMRISTRKYRMITLNKVQECF